MSRPLLAALTCLLAASTAHAQYAPAPTQYSLVSINPDQTLHIYRDGNKALVENFMPKGPDVAAEVHTRTIIDVPSNTELLWNLDDSSIPCDIPSKGDWGNPFGYWAQFLEGTSKPKKIGKATVNGMATTVYSISRPGAVGTAWRDDKYGLLVKFAAGPKGGKQQTILEIKDFKVGKPDPKIFAVPSRCKWKK